MKSPYGLPCVESCLSCELRSDSFFCSLPKESLEAFNQIKHGAVYPAEAVIFVEGQIPRGIFVLCQGQVKLSTTSREGKTFILRIAKAGEIIGLHSVVSGQPYELTVETMKPSQLDFVGSDEFLRFLKTHGDACLRAAQHLSRDCLDAYNVVRSIGLSRSAPAKVAKFILDYVADEDVKKGAIRAKLALTHEDLSQLMGTSRETITRVLAEFRKKEIVELKGSTLIIHNKSELEKVAVA
jgi:CRP/FNR family transcriptional regulator